MLAQSVHELPFGSQAQVAVSTGKVAAFLAYVGYDPKIQIATYALRILNDSASPVQAQLSCILRDGTQRSASPLTFKVAPYAMRDDYVPVRLDITGRFERAVVEVISEDTYFTVEALPPPSPRRNWLRWGAAAFLPLVVAGTAGAMTPRVAPLTAPERAYAGSSIAVPYEASGYGNIEYSFTSRNGVQISAGIASDKSGILRFALPAEPSGSPYTVRVRIRSPFSSAEQSATVAMIAMAVPKPASAEPKPQPALIDDVRMEPPAVHAGTPITVKYSAHTTDGDVSLIDSDGATWERVPLSSSGSSVLSVPAAAAGRTMRVVVHAQQGGQQAQKTLVAMVLAAEQIHTPAPAQGQGAIAPPSMPTSTPTLSLSSTVAAAGDTVSVRVGGMHGDVRITLTDSAGTTVAEGDGSDGALSLAAPNVRAVTKYFVVATFSDGVAQQSVVKPLVVTPR